MLRCWWIKNSISRNKLKEDLVFYKGYWTILFGSALNQNFIPERSDIDIAIITQKKDKNANVSIWESILGHIPPNYDVKIFELLPLYIQIDIIKNHLVVFGNLLEISEYFYFYRKIWKDMAIRINTNQFNSIQEKLERLAIQKKIILH